MNGPRPAQDATSQRTTLTVLKIAFVMSGAILGVIAYALTEVNPVDLGEPMDDVVLYAIAGGSYLAGLIASRTDSIKIRTWAVRLGVTYNLLILGWFKYTTFLLGNLNTAMGGEALTVPEIILPIGLSFLAFQSISYIIDVALRFQLVTVTSNTYFAVLNVL